MKALSVPYWCQTTETVSIEFSYEAEIIGEEGEDYLVQLFEGDGGTIEGKIPKGDFAQWPHPIKEGTCFGVVTFREKGRPGTTASPWPIPEYWHPSQVPAPDLEIPDINR